MDLLKKLKKNLNFKIITMFENNPQHAGTANTLKTADPKMVPTPRSPSVTKVPTIFIKSSGLELAAAIKVAPATSSAMCRPNKTNPVLLFQNLFKILINVG